MNFSESNGFSAFKDKIMWLAIAGIAWWIWTVHEKADNAPSKSEVQEMISQFGPYAQERALIHRRLDDLDHSETKVVEAIKDNTKAIHEMRVQVERLLVIKPSDVIQKVAELEETLEKVLSARGPPLSTSG
jgi:chromosome segregation ATPase